jgi:glycosyltransferase involved in cell wall biosynthesis
VTSVVIAAHNEAAVIGKCLDALLADAPPGPFDVTVVANGCTDATAEVAESRPGVRVLSLPEPGKAGALNAGDEVAVGFPRLYLDADIVLVPGSVPALVAAVRSGLLAAAPGRKLDTEARPLPVRAYYAINRRLPAFRDALYGRGAIMLSADGRARFDRFPELHADDLFLDSLFQPGEKREVAGALSTVATPRRTADLIRRLVRVRAGNKAMRAAGAGPSGAVRASRRSSWFRDVVLPRPWLAPAGVFYAAITLIAERRSRGAADWGRDESSRVAAPPAEAGASSTGESRG